MSSLPSLDLMLSSVLSSAVLSPSSYPPSDLAISAAQKRHERLIMNTVHGFSLFVRVGQKIGAINEQMTDSDAFIVLIGKRLIQTVVDTPICFK